MPDNGNNNKEFSEITIKEASSKLDVSEATVKKYLKDFDLKVLKGIGSKAVISGEIFQALSEIAKLRANGLSIQEIKELKAQEPSKHILDEVEETEATKSKDTDIQEDTVPDSIVDKDAASDNGKDVIEDIPASEHDKYPDSDTGEIKYEAEEELKDLSESDQESTRRVRRGFNYRYVERQIANDSKRISSLRQRLRNPNLSVRDRLFFEEALERRILFLDGWKHILRWISSK